MNEAIAKLGIEEVQANPGLLRVAPDQEILNLHRRLHQQYGLARERGEATEYPWVNVHVWVVQEMRRRGFNHNINDDLDRETERLTKGQVPEWLARRLAEAKEAILVPAYVSVVGSATREDKAPADLDVLVREDENVLTKGWRESVMLLVRKLLDPEKTGLKLHILANPQGPHLADGQGYVPIFDLVLRPRAPELVTKAASAMPNWERWLAEAPQGRRIDLGPGEEGPPEGFEGLGRPFDLEETWPLEPNSVAVLRANHVFEHLREPAHAMTEAWRVLMPGGLLIVTVPEASSPGAVAHPEHRSLWNAESFLFWTRADLLETIERRTPEPFELLHLAVRDENGLRYVDAVLRKPARAAAKRALVPIATFTPPKPAQRGRAHTDAFSPEEIWPWVEKHLEGGVVAEPKFNGFRAVVQSDGRRVSIRFEDSQQERYPQLVKADPRLAGLLQLPPFILDCDLGVMEGGKRWSRPRLMTLTAAEPQLPRDAQIIITAFDVLYWDGEEVAPRPFRERRALLEKISPQLEEAGVQIPPQMPIRTKDDLVKAWRSPRFGLADRSEGLVLKALDWVYEPGPATDGMAKIKHALEIKAIVLEVKRTKDGSYNFRGGLLPGTMVHELDNLVEFRGRTYVDLGFSFNAPFAAQPGDIITAEVEEITWDMADRRLNWLGAKPLDVDKERSQPYSAAQVIDMARRARLLQEVPAVTKGVRKPPQPPEGGESQPPEVAPAVESKHLRVEVKGPFELLDDPDFLRRVALSLLQGERIIEEGWHKFEPQGVSGFIMLSTSHIAVHTWPEEERAIWDIESCHVDADPALWLRRLQREFNVVVSKGDEEGDEVVTNADDLPRRGHFNVMGVLWPYMERILRFVPRRGIKRIVEPFCGAGELIWFARAQEHVLADIDPDIVRLHRICRDLKEEDYQRLRRFKWVGDEGYYNRLWDAAPPDDDLSFYHRELYVRRFGKRGREAKGFRREAAGTVFNWEPRVRAAQRRLQQNVRILRADFRTTLRRFDAPDTFFFLDPPWPSRENMRSTPGQGGYYRYDNPPVEEIAEAMRQLRGKAMLIIEGKGDQLKPLREAGFYERKFAWRHPWAPTNDHVQPLTYVSIFTNYDPDSVNKVAKDDDETRGEAALRNWEENWQEAMPLSGKAQPFILHAHWRGLTEEEAQLSMEGLLKTNNSLHFDLRLGTDRFNGWWGISLFAGTTEENREQLRVFRMMEDPDERLESVPKQFGPRPWLEVGKKEPLVVPPGGVGSTSKAWSKFFAIDWGTWRLGFARQHAVEIFLEGKRLKGRFLWQYAPLEEGGERKWLFTRPEDQRPYAQTHRLEDVIKELADKGQRWLVWPKDPDDLSKGHRLIDVQEEAKRLRLYRVLRSEEERRYTLGVVYPVREVDAHGDYTTPEELEQAAWEYMRKSRKVGLMHRPGTEGAGEVVESYIYRGPPWEINGQVVEPGDWLMGVIWREDVWPLIKEGQITGFSLQGWARRNGR